MMPYIMNSDPKHSWKNSYIVTAWVGSTRAVWTTYIIASDRGRKPFGWTGYITNPRVGPKLEIRSKFAVLWFHIWSADHNKISLWSVEYVRIKGITKFHWITNSIEISSVGRASVAGPMSNYTLSQVRHSPFVFGHLVFSKVYLS